MNFPVEVWNIIGEYIQIEPIDPIVNFMTDLHGDVSWSSNIKGSPYLVRIFESSIADTLALHASLYLVLS